MGSPAMQSDDTADALWSFSLALYGRPGVPAWCLDLQDAHGADVNVMLALLFAGTRGVRLDESAVDALDAAVRGWRDDVVIPLRGVRRRLKTEEGDAQALRTTIKGAELTAERLEQQALAAHLGPLPDAPRAAAARAAAAANLAHYLAPRGAAAKADAVLAQLDAIGR